LARHLYILKAHRFVKFFENICGSVTRGLKKMCNLLASRKYYAISTKCEWTNEAK